MAEKLKTSLPEFMYLGGGWIIEWDAVDPTTGASVAGVVVSGTSLVVAGDETVLANVPNPILIAAGSG